MKHLGRKHTHTFTGTAVPDHTHGGVTAGAASTGAAATHTPAGTISAEAA